MFREATPHDAAALRDLEREANLAGLGHVFAPERHPFPDDAVLTRWVLVLEEPGVSVVVRDCADGRGIDVLMAHDDTTLRHLAVRPDHWGEGLAARLIETALEAMRQRGTEVAGLWCLEENHRARRLYEHLGWRATDERRPAPWPPHPVEMSYTRPVPQRVREPLARADP